MAKRLPSEEYWIKRAALTLVHSEKNELEFERDMELAYKRARQHVKKEIEAFYERYGKEQGLSTAEVKKSLNTKELKSFKEQHKYYLDEVEKYGADPAYKNYLKKLSARAYVSRLEELITNIRHEVEMLAAKQHTGMEKMMKEGYEDGFYRSVFDLQKQVGVGVSFSKPGKETVEKAVRTKWFGRNFSSSVWNNKKALVFQINQLLPQAFAAGRTSHDVAEQLDQKLQSGYKVARRLARTEINFISNQATLDGYKASGVVTHYKYLATLDNRTSEQCQGMDGKVVPITEAQVGVNLPPLHAHCRSTTIPYFEDDDIGKLIDDRVATNEEDKTYFVGNDVTYEDWVKDHAEASYAKRVTKAPEKYEDMDYDVPATMDTDIKTLQNFAAHTKKWEEDKVSSLLSAAEIKTVEDTVKELIDRNDFCMRVPANVLEKIISDGKFKNTFESKNGGIVEKGTTREKAVSALFGANVSTMEAADFEKYGYLGQTDFVEEWKNNSKNLEDFGEIRIVFDKTKIKDRTTFTTEDSLIPGVNGELVAGDVNNPRANGVPLNKLKKAVTAIDSTKKDNSLEQHLNNPFSAVKKLFGSDDYLELQYHGQVSTEDIKAIQLTNRTAESLLRNIEDDDDLFDYYREVIRDNGSDSYEELNDVDKNKVLSATLKYMFKNKVEVEVYDTTATTISTNKPPKRKTLDYSLATLKNYAGHAAKWERHLIRIDDELVDEEIELLDKTMRQLIENNEFCMRVPSKVLDKILTEGKFKNQFETGTSGGTLDRSMRMEATSQLFGAEAKSILDADFEKYGYLGEKDFAHETKAHPYSVVQYGDVRIVFNKQTVSNRTTFTTDDSLGPARNGRIIAGDVNNPRANGQKSSSLRMIIRNITNLDDEDIFNDPIDFSNEVVLGRYVELQYHGQLTTKDIEKIQMSQSSAKTFLETNFKQAEYYDYYKKSIKEKGATLLYQLKPADQRAVLSSTLSYVLKNKVQFEVYEDA